MYSISQQHKQITVIFQGLYCEGRYANGIAETNIQPTGLVWGDTGGCWLVVISVTYLKWHRRDAANYKA